jgi:hypothetical protein
VSPTARDDLVVVVSGLPRSGTSMMMRMLVAGGLSAQSDARRAADADNPLGYFEDERVKDLARDAAWISEARGKAVKVVSALLKHLPPGERYRIVFMRREIGEVLASQRQMLVRLGKTADPAGDERLRELFARHLETVTAELACRAHTDVLYVDYARTVAEPAVEAARVNVFLGGGLDERAMAAAVDPSLYRQKR